MSSTSTSTTPRVVLTGTTGGLGSAVLKYIPRHLSPESIIISLYDPSKATAEQSSYDVRRGDYLDQQSLQAAFKGADVLFLVSYPSIAHHMRFSVHKNAIDAAKAVGVTHVIYTSIAFAGQLSNNSSAAAVMLAHLDTEAYLKSSGLTYTIIREGIYAESYPLYLGFFDPRSDNNQISIPQDGDGGVAWVSRVELGEATAAIVAAATQGIDASIPYKNETILFSGREAISHRQLTQLLGNILHRNLTLKYVELEEYTASSAVFGRRGIEFGMLWATTYTAIKNGECAVVDPAIEKVLGRKPKSMETILKELLKDINSAASSVEQYAK